jgi:acyl-coenzyme A synthetase/AMP-(fatty) acid ligase
VIFRRREALVNAQPIQCLVARAADDPEGLLFDDGINSSSNQASLRFVQQLAAYFDELGIKRGDIVGLNMPPALYLYFLMATWHRAGIATNFTSQIAQDTTWKPEWIFSTVDFDPNHGNKVIIVSQPILDYIKSLEPLRDAKSYKSASDPIALVFSSGTTGIPKAFPLTLANLEARIPIYFDSSFGYSGSLVLLDIGTAVGIRAFYGEMRTNGCYLVPGDMSANVKNASKHKTRTILGSPIQIAAFFTAAQGFQPSDIHIQTVIATGSALSRVLASEIRDYFKCEIVNAYGSQEAGLVSIRREGINPFDLGQAIPGIKVEIVDSNGRKVPVGVTGKIRTKSKGVVSEYFKDVASTQHFFKDGWFYSGDLGHFDDLSRLCLDGRESELVNVGGVKINPARIDSYVIGKFGVTDAGAFGFTDSSGLEQLGIALVTETKFQEQLLVDGVREYFGSGFPLHSFQVDQILRNEGGKVRRQEIAAQYLRSLD